MFFADPAAAFGNAGRALRPAGRLVMMVWQDCERNEWDVAIRQSLAGPGGSAAAASAARALERLREMLAAHMSGNGVWFDSRAWIVTARRH